MPAYVVFHDATLRDDGRRSGRPRSTALGGISGVGAAKLERYGPGLLAALAGVGEPA